jgi:hypothetical protein
VVKIVRVKNFNSPRTPRDVSGGTSTSDKISASRHDVTTLTKTYRSKFGGVRRLMVKDPTVPLERDIVDQFTNNPNPKYDPSKHPGTVQRKVISKAQKTTSSAKAGHQKSFAPNRQTLFGGKTLRRRSF